MNYNTIKQITNQTLQKNGLVNYDCYSVKKAASDKTTIISCYVFSEKSTPDLIQFIIPKYYQSVTSYDVESMFKYIRKMQ